MRAPTIAKMAWYMPRRQADAGLYVPASSSLSERQASDIMHYAMCHKDLSFGWHFAERMCNAPSKLFPAFLHGNDLFVWRAYKYLQGFEDPVIASAVALTLPGNEMLRSSVEALLTAKDVWDPGIVAVQLNMQPDTVLAYEKLFYNVVDRRKDHSYISSIVYPESRIVEIAKDYFEKVKANELLTRAGYNHGSDIVLYMIGIGEHPFKAYDAAAGAAKLDGFFMQDGILCALLGLQNVPGSVPITNARLSINAGKMGKGDDQAGIAAVPVSEAIRTTMIEVVQRKATAQARLMQPTIDVQVTKQQH